LTSIDKTEYVYEVNNIYIFTIVTRLSLYVKNVKSSYNKYLRGNKEDLILIQNNFKYSELINVLMSDVCMRPGRTKNEDSLCE